MDTALVKELGFNVDRLERVRQTILNDNRDGKVHGAAFMVGRRGQIALELIDGWADKEVGKKLTADDVIAIFAVSKQITAVMALIFVERGVLQLHQPIAELLPQFGVAPKNRITLYHLLTYTSGLLTGYPDMPAEDVNNIEKLTAFAAKRPLESMPGERVCYSVFAVHAVIASLCVKADGGSRSFSQILDEELFQPAGMLNSCLGARPDLLDRLCPIRRPPDAPPPGIEGIEDLWKVPGGEMPGGGGMMTIGDLYRFADLLRNGEANRTMILSPAMIEYMSRNHTGTMRNLYNDPAIAQKNWMGWPANHGLGFWVRGEEGVAPGPLGALMSPRAMAGYGSGSVGFWVDPVNDLTMAFMSTGLLKYNDHRERLGRLSNMVISAIRK